MLGVCPTLLWDTGAIDLPAGDCFPEHVPRRLGERRQGVTRGGDPLELQQGIRRVGVAAQVGVEMNALRGTPQ